LKLEAHDVLAVVVPESRNSPHFTGPAYVRKGGTSEKASDDMLTELVADRLSMARELRKWLGKTISLAAVTEQSARRLTFERVKEVVLKEVNPHWIVWERTSGDSSQLFSIPLGEISLQKDTERNRLLILTPHIERT
jgi:hypothetical protein